MSIDRRVTEKRLELFIKAIAEDLAEPLAAAAPGADQAQLCDLVWTTLRKADGKFRAAVFKTDGSNVVLPPKPRRGPGRP